MPGLLDYLYSPDYGNGVGGLLSYLNTPTYRSPLQTQQEQPQAQYDAMGNVTVPAYENPASPFPALNVDTAQYQPKSVFNGGVNVAPVSGIPSLGQQSQTTAPAQPDPQAAPAQPEATPYRNMAIGGYQMPQIGSAADYTPRATDMSAQSRAPQAAPSQMPPALGGRPDGFFDQINNGLQSLGNGGSIIGALTGNRTDSQSIQQQNLTAQFNALRSGLIQSGMSPQEAQSKAMIAVMNPEAAKTIIPELFSNKQKFTEIGIGPDGTKQYGFVNDREQTVSPYNLPGSDTPATITGPDGKQIAIPPGVDRKTFVNEVSRANAKAAAGEKTEVQAKAEIFANKMELSNKEISDGVGTSLTGKIASGIPLGNYVQSPEYQKYKQASSNFITALLRQESGAAISKSEFDRYDKEYMPQPGDSKEVLAQKAQARQVAIEGMKKGAGPGYKSPTEMGPPAGTVQMGYRFKGGNPADRNSWEKVQ